eukprot:4847280-Pyramimonas_sp.AAC.2
MPEVYDALAERLIATLSASDNSTQKLICVAGGPGAGKTTLTGEVRCLSPFVYSVLPHTLIPVEHFEHTTLLPSPHSVNHPPKPRLNDAGGSSGERACEG